jgi:hypothetical protein
MDRLSDLDVHSETENIATARLALAADLKLAGSIVWPSRRIIIDSECT